MSKHYVHVADHVIAQMILNGFEAFTIKHGPKKRHAIEMSASLFGNSEENQQSIHHIIQVMSPHTSAEMLGGSTSICCTALDMKAGMGKALGYSTIAYFHSHPYLAQEISLDDMRKIGCRFSHEDYLMYEDELNRLKQAFYISGVLGIRNTNRQDDLDRQRAERVRTERDGFVTENLFEFTIAECKCFLLFQAFGLDHEKQLVELPTVLKCEYLEKFKYLKSPTPFGKIRIQEGKQRIVEYVSPS